MQCWTYDELKSWLQAAGFGCVAYFGAYDAAIRAGLTDRLVVVAQRLRSEAEHGLQRARR